MADDRLRVPIDDPYLRSVGLATICFARLEWMAVWCCEKLRPGYLDGVEAKTAGQIAADLIAIVESLSDAPAEIGEAAIEFRRLVKRRNDLVHAKPGTAQSGAQRLFRHGLEWTIATVDELADEFVRAEQPLNRFFHEAAQ